MGGTDTATRPGHDASTAVTLRLRARTTGAQGTALAGLTACESASSGAHELVDELGGLPAALQMAAATDVVASAWAVSEFADPWEWAASWRTEAADPPPDRNTPLRPQRR